MGSSRDDFSAQVKKILANRAGHRCSYQPCNQVTIGPDGLNPMGSVNSGEAAHITAAAAGGPRYDPNMTSEERKSISNGIWMCAYHAGLIDNDHHSYSVEQLKQWKEIAEAKQAELQRMSQQPTQPQYSDRDIGILKQFTDMLNFNYLWTLENEPFRAVIPEAVIYPLDWIKSTVSNPFYSFNDRFLEQIRLELNQKVDNFFRLFNRLSVGLNYIDIPRVRREAPGELERYYQYIDDTRDLARDICLTARKLLDVRARLE